MGVGEKLPTIGLQRADGSPVELGAFLERTLIVVALRYYG